MSWDVLHQMVGLACIDDIFAQELLAQRIDIIEQRGFHLTPEERDAIAMIHCKTLASFSQQLLEYLEYTP